LFVYIYIYIYISNNLNKIKKSTNALNHGSRQYCPVIGKRVNYFITIGAT